MHIYVDPISVADNDYIAFWRADCILSYMLIVSL